MNKRHIVKSINILYFLFDHKRLPAVAYLELNNYNYRYKLISWHLPSLSWAI